MAWVVAPFIALVPHPHLHHKRSIARIWTGPADFKHSKVVQTCSDAGRRGVWAPRWSFPAGGQRILFVVPLAIIPVTVRRVMVGVGFMPMILSVTLVCVLPFVIVER
jgi:hypothetical protein